MSKVSVDPRGAGQYEVQGLPCGTVSFDLYEDDVAYSRGMAEAFRVWADWLEENGHA